MRRIRPRLKPVSIFLVVLMLTGSQRATEARAYIAGMLAREDIQKALIDRGIDPVEAQARVGTLTDREAVQFADTMEQLPAGGVIGYIVGLAVLVFLVLLVTDILGYTDIFPFVKKTAKQ